MKKLLTPTAALLICLFVSVETAEAQLFKGFGKKLEEKIENRIERKADRQVDKVLDKADKKTDEPIDNVLNKPKKKNDVVEARPEQGLTLVGSSCADFSWFNKGAILAYEEIDEKGKSDGELKMEVLGLTSKGSATIAEVEATISSSNFDDLVYTMNYICDGDMLYMDISAMMKAMMENNPEMEKEGVQEAMQNMEIDFSNGYASFPKKMYPGMELDDLSFSFKTKSGPSEMSFETVVTDRQVVANENVTTKAGTFACLKIRSVSNTTLNALGIDQTMPSNTEYMWIAPGVGMVKQETYTEKEKMTTLQLKTYER